MIIYNVRSIQQLLIYHHLHNDINITDFLCTVRLDCLFFINTFFTINIGYNIYINESYPRTMMRNNICYEILVNCDLNKLYKYLKNNRFIKSKFDVRLVFYAAPAQFNGISSYSNNNQLIITQK